MPAPATPDTSRATVLQPGFRAVPISEADAGSALWLCLVVQEKGGPFVLLRDTADVSIFLGCVTDGGGQVHHWLEVWVQNLDDPATLPDTLRETLSNRVLDQRWLGRIARQRNLDASSMLYTNWETRPPRPIFLDPTLSGPVPLLDPESGERWELCRDDALLAAHELPPYTASLHRYLYRRATAAPPFVPVTPDAPVSDKTRPLAEIAPGLVPFNPRGGFMLLRHFAPLACEEWIDLLSGSTWKGAEHAGKAFKLDGVYRTLQDANAIRQGSGHLFLGRQGKGGRLIEAHHLKASLLSEAIRATRIAVKTFQLPLLNLSADSFRVRLTGSDAALPFFYTARTALAAPGEAFALPLESTEGRHFLAARPAEASIYRPAEPGLPIAGRGTVRIRKVTQAGGGTVLEGTLGTQQRLPAGGTDLLKVLVHPSAGRVTLYGHLEASSERLAAGEARFRTLPQKLAPEVAAALQQSEGVPFADAPFETLPVLSSPVDLYALGVLAVRAFLVDEQQSLPVALDEILSLARKVAASHNPAVSLIDRVAALVEADPHWRAALSPARLVRDEAISDDEGWSLFPAALWWKTLATLVRMFPGIGPDSHCRDFGDAPALALEEVFTAPLAEFDDLVLRSRSLIVSDWHSNLEIRTVISGFIDRLTA